MGLIAEIFAATVEEQAALPGDQSPGAVLDSVAVKGTTPVEIEILRGQLLGLPFDPKLPSLTMVAGDKNGDGPWTFIVEAAFLSHLAMLSDGDLGKISARWAAIEGFSRVLRTSAADVHYILEVLVTQSRRAASENKQLYVWFCL